MAIVNFEQFKMSVSIAVVQILCCLQGQEGT